jgi:hypothetical protein
MSVSVSKTLLFPSVTNIKFSDLRSSFKEMTSGSIKASELRRNTSTSATNPIVPDATENAAVASSTNLKLSQFQNTIKSYDLNQTGTDLNLDLFTQTWNSNLYKNVRKKVNINGICGSNSTSSAALNLSGVSYNLFLIINGSVLGAGGPSVRTYQNTGVSVSSFNRYWNGLLHFYTSSFDAEGDTTYALESYNYFNVLQSTVTGAVPLYRVYNPTTKSHLLTININEYTSLPGYTVQEGIKGYVFNTSSPSTNIPVYRSYNSTNGDYLFTTSLSEKNSAAAAGWAYQGIAFYSPIGASNNGGNAMSLFSTGGPVNVLTTGSAQVYGGGGGGGSGKPGGAGPVASCYYYAYNNKSGCTSPITGCPSCPAGYTKISCSQTVPLQFCGVYGRYPVVVYYNYTTICRQTVYYNSAAPAGGAGGLGGLGQGYNQTVTKGFGGSPGATSSCSPYTAATTTYGGTGGAGGAGGGWGSGGTGTTFATAGGPGRAISGSNYTIDKNSVSAAFLGPR